MKKTAPGVPLGKYRGQADVLLICDACPHTQIIPLETVIARLDARGLNGEQVGIVELARLTTAPCPNCQARSWSTRPAFHPIPGLMGFSKPA